MLDRTVFYARGGGQPGDTGKLWWEGGEIAITDTVKGEGDAILHVAGARADRCPPREPLSARRSTGTGAIG